MKTNMIFATWEMCWAVRLEWRKENQERGGMKKKMSRDCKLVNEKKSIEDQRQYYSTFI